MLPVISLPTGVAVKAVAPEDGQSQDQTDHEEGQTNADVRTEGVALVPLEKTSSVIARRSSSEIKIEIECSDLLGALQKVALALASAYLDIFPEVIDSIY